MGISSITSMNGISGMQMTMASSTDTKNKNIQKEITDVQQQMRALSSKDELSVNEKANERKTLQKKIASLNTELKQHQEELSKSQKREIMMAELQEDKNPAKAGKSEGKRQPDGTSSDKTDETKENTIGEKGTKTSNNNTNTGLSRKETTASVSKDTSAQQANHQGIVITKTNDGTVLLKGKMNQNAKGGIATEKKATDEMSFNNGTGRILPIDKQQTNETQKEALSEKETKNVDNEKNTDSGLSRQEMLSLVSADASVQQAGRQGTVIARISGDIVILKGEIKQDEQRGIDTKQKQEELKEMEQREERARTFQTSVLGETNNVMKSAAKTMVSGTTNKTQDKMEMNTPFRNAFQLSQEAQASQQRFYISLD